MSEIKEEMKKNLEEMEKLIRSNEFNVGKAYDYLQRYYNIYRKMEDLEKSRDLWRNKFEEAKKCQRCEICLKHS